MCARQYRTLATQARRGKKGGSLRPGNETGQGPSTGQVPLSGVVKTNPLPAAGLGSQLPARPLPPHRGDESSGEAPTRSSALPERRLGQRRSPRRRGRAPHVGETLAPPAHIVSALSLCPAQARPRFADSSLVVVVHARNRLLRHLDAETRAHRCWTRGSLPPSGPEGWAIRPRRLPFPRAPLPRVH